MRESTAFFCGIFLFGATFVLYFILEYYDLGLSSSTLNSNQQQFPDQALRVDGLEKNYVQHAENTITTLPAPQSFQDEIMFGRNKNRKVQQVKFEQTTYGNKIRDIATTVIQLPKVILVGVNQTDLTSESRNLDDLQCPTVGTARTEIQMSDVYDLIPFDNPDGGVWKQGWQINYMANQWSLAEPLQVFIVPHSHNDPGWLRTFEEYFEDHTKHIFNLMIEKLPVNPERKIIWAEISYLSLWWRSATEQSKAIFKQLVRKGQIELVTGGWVMTDEANSHYSAMINQLLEGHEWIKNNLGECVLPKHGWSIDPFGFSATMAYILKLHNFDGMLIQRTHYSVKKHLGQIKSLEFQWRQAWDVDGSTDVLCHMMPFYFYDIPHTCGPDPKICFQFDFKRLIGGRVSCPWGVAPRPITDENIQERAETLLDQYRKKAQLTKSNVIIAPLGDDFRYDTALEWDNQFFNYEKLIRYYNTRSDLNVKIQFGTLKDYFDALKKDTSLRKIAIPSLSGDFFTYADREEHYWSGYYTTRPFYKSLGRKLETRLRSAEIIFAIALAKHQRNPSQHTSFLPSVDLLLGKLVVARRNLALYQHHDGITGTAKTAVVTDYAQKMLIALINCDEIISKSLGFLLFLNNPAVNPDSSSSPSTNVLESDEEFQGHDKPALKKRLQIGNGRRIVVYNSLGQSREELVMVWVDSAQVTVEEEQGGTTILSQINPVWLGETLIADKFQLVFIASVPALGVRTYLIKPKSTLTNYRNSDRTLDSDGISTPASVELYSEKLLVKIEQQLFNITAANHSNENLFVENSLFKLSFDGKTGYLQSMTRKESNIAVDVGIKFIQYGVTNKREKSGAYLFLPDGPAKDILVNGILTENHQNVLTQTTPLIRIIRGPVISEVQILLPILIHTVRVIHSTGVIGHSPEIINQVDITRQSNYELAMHFTTSIQNGNDFVTDLNGFQLIRRKTRKKLPLQANYYPMPSVSFMEDSNHRLTILSQQPLGVTSLENGHMEMMQDRRLDQDDNRGMGQPVHDNIPWTQSVFRLHLESNSHLPEGHPVLSLQSHLSLQSLLNPLVVFFDSDSSHILRKDGYSIGLPQDLPCDVHLLNVRTTVARESGDGVVSAFPVTHSVEGATALVLLHRIGVDCRGLMPSLKCHTLKGGLNLRESFKGIFKLSYIDEGSISPLDIGGKFLPVGNTTVKLDVMHVHPFRFPLI